MGKTEFTPIRSIALLRRFPLLNKLWKGELARAKNYSDAFHEYIFHHTYCYSISLCSSYQDDEKLSELC